MILHKKRSNFLRLLLSSTLLFVATIMSIMSGPYTSCLRTRILLGVTAFPNSMLSRQRMISQCKSRNIKSSAFSTTTLIREEITKQPHNTKRNTRFFMSSSSVDESSSVSAADEGTTTIETNEKTKNKGGGGQRVSSAVLDKDTLSKTSSSSTQKQQVLLDVNPPKGTRDFFPADMRLRNWLFDNFKQVARLYAFEEYDAPVLENESLYTRKAGEEVTQQLYCFEDKGGRRVSLRPEMTPSLARMVMSKKGGLPLPLKYCSIPQCWRYERMTRGRRREHYQWNMDIWGISGIQAELELISAMVTFFQKVGLSSDDIGIKINSRKVIAEVLEKLQVPEDKFAATCVLVDKLEKVPIDAIQSDLEELGLTRDIVEQLTQVMSGNLDDVANVLGDDSEALKELQQFMSLAKDYSIEDWIVFDASVVRGLAYYTGVVFEAFDRKGVLRAIAGGGRYDKLLQTFGASEPIPAVGFGFGDAVIVELLKDRNLLPSFDSSEFDVVVFALGDELQGKAATIAMQLRQCGLSTDLILENKKLKWVMKYANRVGVKHLVIVAPDEYAEGNVSIKNMMEGTQETIAIDTLKEWATKHQL